jgi:hypothetical protein
MNEFERIKKKLEQKQKLSYREYLYYKEIVAEVLEEVKR